LKFGYMYPPIVVVFFKIALNTLDPLHVHVYFRISLSVSIKISGEVLTGIVLNLAEFKENILTILSLLIHEHFNSFHRLSSPLISLSSLF
jgi:hypothetical protein